MARKEYTVVHKKSNVVNSGVPKLPSASTLEYGEIAVNYGTGGETLSIRNSSDQIATFPSKTIIEGMLSSEGEKYLTTATTIPTTAAEVGAMATSERGNYLVTGTTLDNVADGATRKLSDYLTTATTIPNVDNYFDDVEYDSGTKRINFKHGETVKDYIDATNFIKDGMVDEVKIATPTGGTNSGVTCLVVTFNTDAGKEDIEIPISSIFNASNYLSTGATLDDVADGDTRKLANYSLTSHTHSEYSLTSHTHSIYATTADTPFWVTYGTTSYSDILSAYNANRLILCEYGEHVYRCTGYDEQGDLIEFACIDFGESGRGNSMKFLYCAGLDSQSVGWSTGSTQYEVASNKVNSISSASTNTQYASAKAVYDSIKSGVTSAISNYNVVCFEFDVQDASHPTSSDLDGTYDEATGYLSNGRIPYLKINDDRYTLFYYLEEIDTYNNILTFVCDRGNAHEVILGIEPGNDSDYVWVVEKEYLTTATTIPTESTIASSGFTKNGVTGINVNGTATTITNGVADITIPSGLPAVTASDNGKVLTVVNGAWTAVTPTVVYTGNGTPDNSLGNNGDLYLQTSE